MKNIPMDKEELDKQVRRNKVMHYCNYRERCVSELRQKLGKMDLEPEHQKALLQEMLEIGMVDDKRYALHFAEGKFRIKKWGKNKIKQALLQKGIASGFIFDALDSIDEEEYQETVKNLMRSKKRSTKSKSDVDLKAKIYRFLYYKGYEPEIIRSVMVEL